MTAVKDKGGNTAIAAYVTPETADIEALKSTLKETLPDYMIPAFWVTLNELPVTANGKVDRKALPEPDIEAGSGEYKAPTTDMEELLAGIWQDVLECLKSVSPTISSRLAEIPSKEFKWRAA